MNLIEAELNNNNSQRISWKGGFLMLLGFGLVGLVVASLIGGLVIVAATGGKFSEIQNMTTDPRYASTLRLVQVISMLISMFLPTLLVAKLLHPKPFRLIGFRSDFHAGSAALVLAILIVAAFFIGGALTVLNKDIADALGWKSWAEGREKAYASQVGIMLDMKGAGGLFLSLFIMAFLPAVCEEMLFRGGLQNFLTRSTRKPWLSITVVSILFSLVHFSVYGFLTRFFLGMVLGLIYHYTQNVWYSILAHFFDNALAVAAIYVLTQQQGKPMQEAMDQDLSAAYWGLLAIPVLVLLFKVLRKKEQPQAEPTNS